MRSELFRRQKECSRAVGRGNPQAHKWLYNDLKAPEGNLKASLDFLALTAALLCRAERDVEM